MNTPDVVGPSAPMLERFAEITWAENGFRGASLKDDFDPAEILVSEMPDGTAVRYSVHGDLEDAQHVVAIPTPFVTLLDSDAFQMQLEAGQELLGSEFCVVGIETHNPVDKIPGPLRRGISEGDFNYFSGRILRALKHIGIREDQTLSLSGYSMSADVGVQLADDLATNPNRGVLRLDALSAFEPARTVKRYAILKLLDFKASGKDFFDNVVAGDLRPQLDAWDIDPNGDLDAQFKAFEKMIGRDFTHKIRKDPAGHFAMAQGFGTTVTLEQIRRVDASGAAVPMIVGRFIGSKIFPAQAFYDLQRDLPGHQYVEEEGDHSRGSDYFPNRVGSQLLRLSLLLPR